MARGKPRAKPFAGKETAAEEAAEEQAMEKGEGPGMKRGGRAHHAVGGPVKPHKEMAKTGKMPHFPAGKGLAKGGAAREGHHIGDHPHSGFPDDGEESRKTTGPVKRAKGGKVGGAEGYATPHGEKGEGKTLVDGDESRKATGPVKRARGGKVSGKDHGPIHMREHNAKHGRPKGGHMPAHHSSGGRCH